MDKTEKKKKMVETRKKREPIEPDDLVEYRNIKKKRKKDDKTMGEAMGKTVAKGDKGKEKAGKGKATKGKGGKQKSGYKKRVTQSTTTWSKNEEGQEGQVIMEGDCFVLPINDYSNHLMLFRSIDGLF